MTPPNVTVNSPNGGEALRKFCGFDITWDATDSFGATEVEIWLDRKNDGVFEQQIASCLPGHQWSYTWVVSGDTSNYARIKVIAYDGAGNIGFDISNNTFSIIPPGYCYEKAVNNFDMNKDGIIGLVDVVLLINSRRIDEATNSFVQEHIKSVLEFVFAGD